MTQRTTHMISIIGVFCVLFLISPLAATVQTDLPTKHILTTSEPTMLIFISPQYANDEEILTTITAYQTAVKNDLNWDISIVSLNQETNTWTTIDQLIESTHDQHPLKACLMIGEDIQTPLAGDSDYMEKPSNIPWSTIGGETAYEISDQGIICKPYIMSICISFLYPTHELTYEAKKTQLIHTLQRFCIRDVPMTDSIQIFESSELNRNSKEMYQHLESIETLTYHENPSSEEIKNSFSQTSSLYVVHGHSNPSGTQLNSLENDGWFSAEEVDHISTPLFAADGCYVNGWWSNQPDNNNLDTSVDAAWYGSKIFSNSALHVMVLGLLSQTGYDYPVSFLENAMPELLQGKTIADSMIGDTFVDNLITYGDPTFHFTI